MKQRLIISGLVIFTVWPLFHRAMVAYYDCHPWKFCGWAMFAVPMPRTNIRVLSPTADAAELQFVGPNWPTDADRKAVKKYQRRRHYLGRFASQTALRNTLFDQHPTHNKLATMVVRAKMDWRTARIRYYYDLTVHER